MTDMSLVSPELQSMNIETLRNLQTRIRESKGADREIDLAVCKAFGFAPENAIWEINEDLPPELAAHYKRGWTTAAYVNHAQEYKRGVEEAFAARLSTEETSSKIRSLDRDWDFKNNPPFGHVPHYTTDPDGLGACVGLMREALPGWRVYVEEVGMFYVEARPPIVHSPQTWERTRWARHTSFGHALLLAILSAKIAELEAQEKV